MQKVFSRQEIQLNDAITELLEWSVNEKGEYVSDGFPIIINHKVLIRMEHKMYHLGKPDNNYIVFRPFKNLKHTYFISDFLYENEIVDELIKSEEDDRIKCTAKLNKDIIEEAYGDTEAEAKCVLLLYLEAFDLDEDEINELVDGMKKFNQKGQERMLELKEKQKEEKKKRK